MAKLDEPFDALGVFLKHFKDNPTFVFARALWLECTEQGRPVPPDVMAVFFDGIKKQVDDYEHGDGFIDLMEDIPMIELHALHTSDEPWRSTVTLNWIYEYIAHKYAIQGEGCEVVKSRYKRWKEKNKKH